MTWSTILPALSAAFLASLVEVVEAFTIVLAVGTVRGWRSAAAGAIAGLASLTLIVIAFAPVLNQVPVDVLQLAIGVLLLLFGMRWFRKAILRMAGRIPLHDEEEAFANETRLLRANWQVVAGIDWVAAVASFKAIVLEGLEVVFIVIAVGAGRGLLVPAAMGAVLAFVLVLLAGLAIRKPLSRVPENTLKLVVGAMLTAFGIFWAGEGLGVRWVGDDLTIPIFAAIFLLTGAGLGGALQRIVVRAAR